MIIKENFSLAKFCSFGIGGNARFFCIVKTLEELQEAISLSKKHDIDYYIHGGGTNVLFSDKDINKVVIKINNQEIGVSDNSITLGAGTPWTLVANYCQKNKLYGLEPLLGIPGTVGGAAFGNAGAHGMEVKDALIEVECYDTKQDAVRALKLRDIDFAYRHSSFMQNKNLIIWSIKLQISQKPQDSMGDIQEFRDFREQKQPSGKTTGSFFRNPTGDYAGRLIQEVGLKGYQIGGIKSSEKHANFFVNTGNATFEDVIELQKLIQKRVSQEFGVNLKVEVRIIE